MRVSIIILRDYYSMQIDLLTYYYYRLMSEFLDDIKSFFGMGTALAAEGSMPVPEQWKDDPVAQKQIGDRTRRVPIVWR